MGASDLTNDHHDISVTPRRYLQREWKRNKPHLPPSDSLPTLRLHPKRPLFVCAQCGFANTWIPLCLWCEWTSVEATKRFEASLPRPRRLSAPCRAAPVPKKTKKTSRRRVSTDSVISSVGPDTPLGERPFAPESKGVPDITTVLASFHGDMCHMEECLDSNNGAGDTATLRFAVTDVANARGVGQVTTVTPPTPASPLPSALIADVTPESREEPAPEHRQLRSNSRRHLRKPPALSIFTLHAPPATSFCLSHLLGATGANTTPASRTSNSAVSVSMETPNQPCERMSLDIPDGVHVRSTESISSSKCSPSRRLRRMKNLTLMKRGSSLSLRSRSGPSSPLRGSIEIYPASVMEVRQSHAISFSPSHDHDPPPVRLGHPSRPYYSAIRKDMSRPTSPVFSLATPRTPSPIPSHPDYVPRETKSLDCGDRSGIQYGGELRPMSLILPSQAMPTSPGFGFSFSGETEMRMSLSRWRREDAPGEPGDYLFRETSPSRTRVDVMKGRVRQIGKGLKELVLGRS